MSWSAAQARMLGAQSRVFVANASWFPDISLTATGGYASSDLSDVFKWSARAWGVGALLSLPVFDGGRREAGVRERDGVHGQCRGLSAGWAPAATMSATARAMPSMYERPSPRFAVRCITSMRPGNSRARASAASARSRSAV